MLGLGKEKGKGRVEKGSALEDGKPRSGAGGGHHTTDVSI